MNKILFKLIEGKGKFFLMRNCPWFTQPSFAAQKELELVMESIISEALKNGEIVNPEVSGKVFLFTDGTFGSWMNRENGQFLKDGDTFNLPPDISIERERWTNGPLKFRLLPEKPVRKEEYVINQPTESGVIGTHFGTVQKEESQDVLIGELLYRFFGESNITQSKVDEIKKVFTIKRKES